MASNPRRSDGNARRKLTRWLRTQGRPCWICRAFGLPGTIDYGLPAGHPMCFEVDELRPVSRWREFGYPSAKACAFDRDNVDAAHRRCNQWRGNKTVEEVLEIASREAGPMQPPRDACAWGSDADDW